MLEIPKHLAPKPTGNEDEWEQPHFGSLSGFMLSPQHCVLLNLVNCFSICKAIEQLVHIRLPLVSHEELIISASVSRNPVFLPRSGRI